jgi:hypothetical protein
MPLFEPFAHYLAYLATDQQTFRDLRGLYGGLLVPGTIAAWQRQGTGGFVLSLSATEASPPYVIDPRFPLFQQALPAAKQSHAALAEIFGDPSLVKTGARPEPDEFPNERLRRLAEHWVAFNKNYGQTSLTKFDKYATRLGEETPVITNASAPEAVLAPYFVAYGVNDPWWGRSKRLFEETLRASEGSPPAIRVIAAEDVRALKELLPDVPDTELVVWVSGLDEYEALADDLASYRECLSSASTRGQQVFALYGGFFSVLQASVGLDGAAHGVGFSEHRQWRELPKSGAAPARFYMLRWHRYVPQDFAQTLWLADQALCACGCPHCGGRPPIEMTYHDLMKHSVACRQQEINEWIGVPAAAAVEALTKEHDDSSAALSELMLPPGVAGRGLKLIEHLPRWAEALSLHP